MRYLKHVFFAIVVCALLGSCSDDSSTNNTQCTQGELTDTAYLIGSAFLGMATDAEGEILFPIFDMIEAILNDPGYPGAAQATGFRPKAHDDYPHEYHASSQYWLFTYTVGGGDVQVVDSLRFYHGNTIVQWPVEEDLDKIQRGMRAEGTTDTITQTSTITGGIATLGVVTINANGFYIMTAGGPVESTTYECDVTMRVQSTIDDVVLDLAVVLNDGCPTSGTLSYDGDWVYDCSDTQQTLPDLMGTQHWVMSQSYTGGATIASELRLGDTCWEASEDCD